MTERARNRRAMPETAAKMDELRAAFGRPDYLIAYEAGRKVEHGTRPAYLGPPDDARLR